jgi:hypothetical protein
MLKKIETTTPLNRPALGLPSFDVHEENGEMVLHADLGDVEISLDGGDLIVRTEGENGRLPLPFAPRSLRAVSRPGHRDLELHILPRKEASMSWEEARDRELTHWSAVRDAIGTASQVELLTEISAADAFCERAGEETVDPARLCSRCLFYQQFGGCRATGGHMSERVAERDWEGLREMVDEVIGRLRALDVPAF